MNAGPAAGALDVDALIAHHSKSFSLASALFPRPLRRDARVVYACCRRADDLADEAPPEGAAARVAALRAELDLVYAAAPAGDPVVDAFAELVQRRAIPRAYPEALLDGMAMDVGPTRYATVDDLLLYAYRVASSVGLMMCHVMGLAREDALAPAARLGLAMQLTNVCRDVVEDWDRGRLYLPAELLAPAGAPGLAPDPARPWPAAATRPAAAAITRLLDLADAFYADADRGLRDLSPRSRLAVHAARLVYSRIGRVLRRRGADPTRGRAVVSKLRKLALVARAGLATLASLWRPRPAPRPPTRALLPSPVLFTPGAPLPASRLPLLTPGAP